MARNAPLYRVRRASRSITHTSGSAAWQDWEEPSNEWEGTNLTEVEDVAYPILWEDSDSTFQVRNWWERETAFDYWEECEDPRPYPLYSYPEDRDRADLMDKAEYEERLAEEAAAKVPKPITDAELRELRDWEIPKAIDRKNASQIDPYETKEFERIHGRPPRSRHGPLPWAVRRAIGDEI